MSSPEDGSSIIIRGLLVDITAEVLYDYLETKVNGIIKDEQEKPKIEIILNAEMVEKADAIVSFVSIEMANNAVTHLNGHQYQQNDEYTLTAEVHKKVQDPIRNQETDVEDFADELAALYEETVFQRQASRKVRLLVNSRKNVVLSTRKMHKVFIDGFPKDTSTKAIKKTFNAAGKINKIGFFDKNKDAEFSKCLAFFKNAETAKNFIKKFNGKRFPGRKVVPAKSSGVDSIEKVDDNDSTTTAIEPDEIEMEEPVEEPIPPEPTFICIVCTEDWPEKDIISCVPVDATQSKDCHYICIQCSCNQARSLIVDGQVGIGGAGLPCCNQGCENVIVFEPLKKYFDKSTVALLDKRMFSAALTGVSDMEYCIKCPFGISIEANSTVIQYFDCQNQACQALFCRDCKVEFDAHINQTCAEAAPINTTRRNYQEEMSAAVIRICPNCHIRFQKVDGCNFMTCESTGCNTTMCYLCRQTDIAQSHFATGVCDQTANAAVFDEQRLQVIRQRARDDEVNDLN